MITADGDLHATWPLVSDEDRHFGVYLWLLAVTGCRRGEGCALRWNDVDLDGRQLTIQRSIAMTGSTPYEKDTKTHQARRSRACVRCGAARVAGPEPWA